MKYWVETEEPCELPNIEAALKIIDPEAELGADPSGFRLQVHWNADYHYRIEAPDLGGDGAWEYRDDEIRDPRYTADDRRQRIKERIRQGVIEVLGRCFHKRPSWGILSGVRPTKIYHYLRDKGFTPGEIRSRLSEVYSLSPAKADLLLKIGGLQEAFFKPSQYVGVYVGIPFCPSRCHYCSFPAVPLSTHYHHVAPYLEGLEAELEAIGDLCRALNLKVETIYIGGGTPTSLDEGMFARLVQTTVTALKSEHTVEFTVEAGRPETITEAKIRIMLDGGVTRISINPQTMREQTLAALGRVHTIADVYRSVDLVRKSGNIQLNMDLILGLPDESPEIFWDSLVKVAALEPDNITVHTLAPKRAAKWGKVFDQFNFAADEALAAVNDRTLNFLDGRGYHPYYLYRQRRIRADLENIGYAQPGRESVYNIQMMEERQTIMGIGAGSVTKWVISPGSQIIRYQNPKCPASYVGRLAQDIDKKAQQSRLLLG